MVVRTSCERRKEGEGFSPCPVRRGKARAITAENIGRSVRGTAQVAHASTQGEEIATRTKWLTKVSHQKE